MLAITTNIKPIIVSALSAVPKPDSDEVRLNQDCNQSAGLAYNDYVDLESSKYQTLEDALAVLETDLRNAYCSIHVHISHYQATVLKWNFTGSDHFTYFVDTRLPYGGRRAPGISSHLTQAIKQMMGRRGNRMIYILAIVTTSCHHSAFFVLVICLVHGDGVSSLDARVMTHFNKDIY